MNGKRVLLGVTGSIAAYKAVELARELSRRGIVVEVVMTEAATKFVCPLTFEALLGRPVTTGLFDGGPVGAIPHISLASAVDAVLVAPASADAIARIAHGLADDILCCTVLACTRPLIIAPAMDEDMYANAATQANIAVLKQRGAVVVGPASGVLASGRIGAGRMSNTHDIVEHTLKVLGQQGDLAVPGYPRPLRAHDLLLHISGGQLNLAIVDIGG